MERAKESSLKPGEGSPSVMVLRDSASRSAIGDKPDLEEQDKPGCWEE